MTQPDRIVTLLEPPPGGWERLYARRHSPRRSAPSWLALATGVAATSAWMWLALGRTEIQMQLTGGRLIDQRSQDIGLQILEDGSAAPLPSSNANVRIYWVEPAGSTQATTK